MVGVRSYAKPKPRPQKSLSFEILTVLDLVRLDLMIVRKLLHVPEVSTILTSINAQTTPTCNHKTTLQPQVLPRL